MTTTENTDLVWVIASIIDGAEAWVYYSKDDRFLPFDPDTVRTFQQVASAKATYRAETGKPFSKNLRVVPVPGESHADTEVWDDADDTEVYDVEVLTSDVPTDDDIADADEQELAVLIEQCQAAISGLERQAVPYALAAGKALIVVKSKVGHKHFGIWLQANTSVTPRMSQIYMQLANAKCVSHMEIESSGSITGALNAIRAAKAGKSPKKSANLTQQAASVIKAAARLRGMVEQLIATVEVAEESDWPAGLKDTMYEASDALATEFDTLAEALTPYEGVE